MTAQRAWVGVSRWLQGSVAGDLDSSATQGLQRTLATHLGQAAAGSPLWLQQARAGLLEDQRRLRMLWGSQPVGAF